MFLTLIFGVALILVMVISSGVAVDIFEKLAHELKVNRLIMATILVGFSTSLPELFVGLAAASSNQSEIALGNIMGANIANLSWIIGGAALVFGTVPVVGEFFKKELWVTVGLAMTPFLLINDGSLTRVDGLILILLYILYANNILHTDNTRLKHLKILGRKNVVHQFKTKMEIFLHSVMLVLSLLVLAMSAWLLVNLAVKASESLGVSLFWVGMIIIAVATTLPELILSLMASEKREISLILGNILGSVVVNSTLILGVIVLVSPIINVDKLQRGMAGLFLMIILGIFWLFTKSKHKIDRWEGAVLVGIYAMFIGLQLMLA